MDYSKNWLSVCLADDLPENHRARVIIHDGQWHIAEYADMDQLREFARAVGGFAWTLDHVDTMEYRRSGSAWVKCEPYKIECYTLSHKINGNAKCHWWPGNEFFGGTWCDSFWTQDEIPAEAFPIVAGSNGSLVRCYATNDGNTINIYRPNPNAKAVYCPLTISSHLAYIRAHGNMGPCDSAIEAVA